MKSFLPKLAAAMSLALPLAGHAADVNYSFVELNYLETEVDDLDGDGFAVRGSLDVAPNVFVFAQFADVSYDFDLDGETWNIGGGYHWALNNAWDLVGKVGFVKYEIEDFDEDGFFLAGGVRGKVSQQFEVEGGLEYADVDDPVDELTVYGEGRYNFTDQLAAGLFLRLGDDVTTFGLSGRFSF